ncbi:MAG: GNAT family N-acetyltransferase [Usitatibacteraceae bacterium]
MKLSKRPAVPDDLDFLLALRKTTMNEHLVSSGMSTSDENHMKRIELEFQSSEILESSGSPVGLIKATRRGNAWELIQIQLVPDFQGLGIGSELIEGLVAEASRVGASVKLSVLKSNRARFLYERLGFVICGEDERSFHMVRYAA